MHMRNFEWVAWPACGIKGEFGKWDGRQVVKLLCAVIVLCTDKSHYISLSRKM